MTENFTAQEGKHSWKQILRPLLVASCRVSHREKKEGLGELV